MKEMKEIKNIESERILKVGINIQEGLKSAPWAWRDEQTREVCGFEIDIIKSLLNMLNIEPVIVPIEGYRVLTSLTNKGCDIAISAIRSSNTVAGIILTDPYYFLTQKIVSLETEPLHDLSDLRGLKTGVLTKSMGEFIIQEENKNFSPTINCIPYNDVLDLFGALHFKEINSVFIDSPVALWYSKSYMKDKLKVANISYKSGSYSIALREEDSKLKNNINRALKNLNIREILDKYGLWDDAQKTN